MFFTNDLKLSRSKLAPLLFLTVNFLCERSFFRGGEGRNRPALVRLCAFFVPWVPELCSGRLAAPGEDIGASVRSSRGLPRPAARPAAFPSAGPPSTAELTPENSKHALALRITGRPPPLPHAPEGADPRVRSLHTALSPGGKGGSALSLLLRPPRSRGEDALAKTAAPIMLST